LSIAGRGLGFADTRGTLFFNIEAILAMKQPRAFLLENVKRLTTHDHGKTFVFILERLKRLGYNEVRRLTVIEMLRLQGVPDDFKMPLPYSSARKVIGNSVIVPVIQAIASEIFKVFQNKLRHNVYNLN